MYQHHNESEDDNDCCKNHDRKTNLHCSKGMKNESDDKRKENVKAEVKSIKTVCTNVTIFNHIVSLFID